MRNETLLPVRREQFTEEPIADRAAVLADRRLQLLLGHVPVLALEREVVEDDAVSVRAVPGRLAGGGFAGGWVHFAGGGRGEGEGA